MSGLNEWQKNFVILAFVITMYHWIIVFIDYNKKIQKERPSSAQITPIPVRYNELEHNNRWGTFVEAKDTLYSNGYLFVFDTVTLEDKLVGTVTIHPKK